ncbi:uncharacterized protein LOC111303041 [Durio zibethinus]|uniref:Uncharacterized protein LOC111303041 n=1 Tax=Durio zibethinus TaxID=66656 RepID=A0A6P5ZQD8_DURZI|nr:uncharacterized protein LOC111303041 [Durio zibethinus]
MLGKRPRPMIGKLSELLVSGNKPEFWDAAKSPKSPSPRGLKIYDDVGAVGLGIVAALEKSSTGSCRQAICSSNLNIRSNAIVVNYPGKNCDGFRGRYEDLEMESLEDYTYVTSHGPGKSSTKVYYDGGYEQMRSCTPYDSNGFKEIPAASFVEDVTYPTSDFLSSCHLCRKKLHGKDIYMYRGEKAFCSSECRSTQIMKDERKERCRSEASRSAKVSTSSYNTGQIFSTGILAI